MGKKKSSTVRTTISIPRGLKNRMGKVKEDVNWSALACQAFQDKLVEIAARKKEKTKMDVLERLRASKRKSDTADYREGREHGKNWAENTAEPAELEGLKGLRDGLGYDWDSQFVGEMNSAYSMFEALFFAMQPAWDGDRGAAEEFWDKATEVVLGGSAECRAVATPDFRATGRSPEFAKGFAEAALDVWDEYKDRL